MCTSIFSKAECVVAALAFIGALFSAAAAVSNPIAYHDAEECLADTGDYDCYHFSVSPSHVADKDRNGEAEAFLRSEHMKLQIKEIRDQFPPYAAFCSRNPGECDMRGNSVIPFTFFTLELLARINGQVNREIKFSEDIFEYNEEDYWTYPIQGRGDCEDIALEKRRRLVALGLPRAALRMTIGQHKRKLFSHAFLAVETAKGTFILDTDRDDPIIWHATEYNYEARERPDGKWERFDQESWTFGYPLGQSLNRDLSLGKSV